MEKTTSLRVLNSLTNQLEPFTTIDPQRIKWYSCGPTVYDSAHLGHARCYVTFDIIMRILTDYFGYNLFHVMNVTDIDDKIILRARQNYLVDEYMRNVTQEQLAIDLSNALAGERAKAEQKVAKARNELNTELTGRSRVEAEERLAESEHKLKTLSEDIKIDDTKTVRSIIGLYLDAQKGHTVKDNAIFRKHAAIYEAEFLEDMERLNVRPPAVLTRVTEFVPKIVKFIERIIEHGFAYESNGSVYFSVCEFERSHHYPKLRPDKRNDREAMADGEGALSDALSEKRDPADFALWKRSKAGEPSWESPWGEGRPGWHIECSAMASEFLGEHFDVHSGGDDLRFPHHDNEMAQSEACFDRQHCINYFFHAGRLNIEGLKMSKSLKNFRTIRDVLADYSPQAIRISFLMQPWHQPMNFSDGVLNESVLKERQFVHFFGNVRAAIREGGERQDWTGSEYILNNVLEASIANVHADLCNNIDYVSAFTRIEDVIRAVNVYLQSCEGVRTLLLQRVMHWVTKMLGLFGIEEEKSVVSRYETIAPVLDILQSFRQYVREGALWLRDADLLSLCDNLRDEILPSIGVRLEDDSKGSSVWKLDDPKVMRREQEERDALRRAKIQNTITNLRRELDGMLRVVEASTHTVDESSSKNARKSFEKAQREFAALSEKARRIGCGVEELMDMKRLEIAKKEEELKNL